LDLRLAFFSPEKIDETDEIMEVAVELLTGSKGLVVLVGVTLPSSSVSCSTGSS